MMSLWSTKGRIYELLEMRRELFSEEAFTEMQVTDRLKSIEECDKAIRAYVVQEIKENPNSIHQWMLESKARQEDLKQEKKRLDGLLAQEEGEYDRAKTIVLETLQEIGETKLAVRGTLRRQPNGGVQPVEVTQPELLPTHLQRVTVTMPLWSWKNAMEYVEETVGYSQTMQDMINADAKAKSEPDKEAIREALLRDEGVPGCRLAERGEHIRCA